MEEEKMNIPSAVWQATAFLLVVLFMGTIMIKQEKLINELQDQHRQDQAAIADKDTIILRQVIALEDLTIKAGVDND